jgi:hypothetical protein
MQLLLHLALGGRALHVVVVKLCYVYLFYVALDDVRAEMRHLNVGPDLLSEIFKRFRDNRVMYFYANTGL